MPKHVNGVDRCPACGDKLVGVHPELVDWFERLVKPKFPNCHISCGWRGKEEQNACFADGSSKLQWPNSKHNICDSDGGPMSQALDLFEIDYNGYARWAYGYFRDIHEECLTTPNGVGIEWGGLWAKFPDMPHFQLMGPDDESHPARIQP